jgi:transposase-like protein
MANQGQLKVKVQVRKSRYFSEDFKRKKVTELAKRQTRLCDICREYEVSATAVYKWINKYSLMKKKGVKMVVEAESDTARIKALREHIAELEQLLGKKQFEIDFLQKQMELAGDQYGIDLKKKLSGPPSSGSGKTGNNIPTE